MIACTFATVLSAPDCPPEGHSVGYDYPAPIAAKVIASPALSYENPYPYKSVVTPSIHTQALYKNVEYAAPYKYAAATKVNVNVKIYFQSESHLSFFSPCE